MGHKADCRLQKWKNNFKMRRKSRMRQKSSSWIPETFPGVRNSVCTHYLQGGMTHTLSCSVPSSECACIRLFLCFCHLMYVHWESKCILKLPFFFTGLISASCLGLQWFLRKYQICWLVWTDFFQFKPWIIIRSKSKYWHPCMNMKLIMCYILI